MNLRELVRRLEKIEDRLRESNDEDTLAMMNKLIEDLIEDDMEAEKAFRAEVKEFIDEYPEKNWNWKVLYKLKNPSVKFIQKHLNHDWDWNMVLRILPLTVELWGIIDSRWTNNPPSQHIMSFYISNLCQNPTFNGKIIEAFPLKNYWYCNKNIGTISKIVSLNYINKYINKFRNGWNSICIRQDLTMDFVVKNEKFLIKNLPIYMYNPQLSIKYLLSIFDKYKALSCKAYNYGHCKIDWKRLSQNVKYTDFHPKSDNCLIDFVDKPWNWEIINKNYVRTFKKKIGKILIMSLNIESFIIKEIMFYV